MHFRHRVRVRFRIRVKVRVRIRVQVRKCISAQHCIMEHQIMQTCIMGRYTMQHCILKHHIMQTCSILYCETGNWNSIFSMSSPKISRQFNHQRRWFLQVGIGYKLVGFFPKNTTMNNRITDDTTVEPVDSIHNGIEGIWITSVVFQLTCFNSFL